MQQNSPALKPDAQSSRPPFKIHLKPAPSEEHLDDVCALLGCLNVMPDMAARVDMQAVRALWQLCPPDPATAEDLVLETELRQNQCRLEQEKKVQNLPPWMLHDCTCFIPDALSSSKDDVHVCVSQSLSYMNLLELQVAAGTGPSIGPVSTE